MKHLLPKIILVLLLLSMGFLPAQAQRLEKWLEAADTSMAYKDYYSAYHYYTAALQYDSTLLEAWYKRGRAAYEFNNYSQAALSFDRALDYDTAIVYPDIVYHLAKTYQRQGSYQKAIEYYDAFLDNPRDASREVIAAARKGLQDSQWASAARLRQKDLPPAKNLGEGVNSGDSDFGGFYQGDTLYFSSYRFTFEQDEKRPRRNLIQLMQLNPGDNTAVLMSGPFNSDEKHTAYNTFSLDQQTMYYCLCEYINDAEIRCDIVRSEKDSLGFWGPAQPLSINQSEFTNTQPSIGIDPVTGEEVLYFVSDRDHPDAKGGLDIYYGMVQADGDVTTASNFTAINSAMDDVTPSFHALSRKLFFSSEGYQSFGGFDIYSSYYRDGNWTAPANIGISANSSYNEYNYRLDATGDRAVFDSDRPGSMFLDQQEEVCCNDLYQIDLDNELQLEVYTFNALDSTPLYGVDVRLDQLNMQQLLRIDSGAEVIYTTDQVLDSTKQTKFKDNHYTFTLDRQYNYGLEGQKIGFLPTQDMVITQGLQPSVKSIRKDLYLQPDNINLQILVYDMADSTNLLGARVELVQISKEQDSIIIYDEVKEFTNLFEKKDVSANFNYYINVSRPGFEGQSVFLEITPDLLEEYGRNITIDVYLPRTGFPDFLPLSLYFDNAIPYNRFYSPTTDDDFEELCKAYAEKEVEFYEAFSEGLTEEEKFSAQIYYRDFFEREIQGGLERLIEFSERLELYLKLDNSLTVQVRGYTSPLANSRYNDMLSRRRIKSIENFLTEYDGGKLKKYLDNGQLIIEEAPFGEGRVGLDINDNIRGFLANLGDLGRDANLDSSSNRRISVYSLLACIERRVEIIEVQTTISSERTPDHNLMKQ
ncbi:MAG TPA: hypothetical protein VJ953_12975 [Saprospiraceae bacterium]|nr:hypothetical protein [Saprospiraceae bacterium]